jgi:hypothetical protein
MSNNIISKNKLEITLDFETVAERLRVPEDMLDEFSDIFDECAAVADPKFMYTSCPVFQDGPVTHVGESTFTSHIMNVNFKSVKTAWPYISTCGRELYDLARSKDDPLERFWVDQISEQYLFQANALTMAAVKETSGAENIYSMNPGSLADFPISNQRPLFDLLGDVEALSGVWLTDTFLMLPYKSCSGIYFESEKSFVNCALCPREGCPDRRVPYDEMQLNSRYAMDSACASKD